jgi:hypothetical protein
MLDRSAGDPGRLSCSGVPPLGIGLSCRSDEGMPLGLDI